MDRRTISSPSSSCTRRARARRTAPHLIVWPESAIPDLANNHIEYLSRCLPGGERAGLVADDGHAARGRESEDRRGGIFQLRAVDGQGHAGRRLVRQASSRAVHRVRAGARFRARVAAAHEPAVFGFQSRRGAAGAAAKPRGSASPRASATRMPTARRSCRHCAPRRCW